MKKILIAICTLLASTHAFSNDVEYVHLNCPGLGENSDFVLSIAEDFLRDNQSEVVGNSVRVYVGRNGKYNTEDAKYETNRNGTESFFIGIGDMWLTDTTFDYNPNGFLRITRENDSLYPSYVATVTNDFHGYRLSKYDEAECTVIPSPTL